MAIERATSIAKIIVISRGGHLACKVLRVIESLILESKLNGLSLANSSPSSTQERQTNNKDTINHVQSSNNMMQTWYAMRDAICDAYARFDKE